VVIFYLKQKINSKQS